MLKLSFVFLAITVALAASRLALHDPAVQLAAAWSFVTFFVCFFMSAPFPGRRRPVQPIGRPSWE